MGLNGEGWHHERCTRRARLVQARATLAQTLFNKASASTLRYVANIKPASSSVGQQNPKYRAARNYSLTIGCCSFYHWQRLWSQCCGRPLYLSPAMSSLSLSLAPPPPPPLMCNECQDAASPFKQHLPGRQSVHPSWRRRRGLHLLAAKSGWSRLPQQEDSARLLPTAADCHRDTNTHLQTSNQELNREHCTDSLDTGRVSLSLPPASSQISTGLQ